MPFPFVLKFTCCQLSLDLTKDKSKNWFKNEVIKGKVTLRHRFCPSDRSKSKFFLDFGLRPDQNCLPILEGPSVKHYTCHEGSCLQVTLLPKISTHGALLLREDKPWHCVSRETLDKFFISGLLILQCYFYEILQSKASVRPGIHFVLVTYFFIYAKHHDTTMFCSRNLNSTTSAQEC